MPAKPKTPRASSKMPSRRVPSQARAEHTVSVIFEATAQVLNEYGEEALSTNRIAERAGVSIGSLYQYFSSKEAIVLAMLFRERDQMMKKLEALLADADPASGDPGKSDPRHILRAFIRHYIQAFGTGASSYRRLMRLAWRLDQDQALIHSMREASERIAMHLHRLNHPQVKTPTPAMAFVLTRLLAGTVRSASLEESPLLGTREFEECLVDACWGVMAKQSAAAPGAATPGAATPGAATADALATDTVTPDEATADATTPEHAAARNRRAQQAKRRSTAAHPSAKKKK